MLLYKYIKKSYNSIKEVVKSIQRYTTTGTYCIIWI